MPCCNGQSAEQVSASITIWDLLDRKERNHCCIVHSSSISASWSRILLLIVSNAAERSNSTRKDALPHSVLGEGCGSEQSWLSLLQNPVWNAEILLLQAIKESLLSINNPWNWDATTCTITFLKKVMLETGWSLYQFGVYRSPIKDGMYICSL